MLQKTCSKSVEIAVPWVKMGAVALVGLFVASLALGFGGSGSRTKSAVVPYYLFPEEPCSAPGPLGPLELTLESRISYYLRPEMKKGETPFSWSRDVLPSVFEVGIGEASSLFGIPIRTWTRGNAVAASELAMDPFPKEETFLLWGDSGWSRTFIPDVEDPDSEIGLLIRLDRRYRKNQRYRVKLVVCAVAHPSPKKPETLQVHASVEAILQANHKRAEDDFFETVELKTRKLFRDKSHVFQKLGEGFTRYYSINGIVVNLGTETSGSDLFDGL